MGDDYGREEESNEGGGSVDGGGEREEEPDFGCVGAVGGWVGGWERRKGERRRLYTLKK